MSAVERPSLRSLRRAAIAALLILTACTHDGGPLAPVSTPQAWRDVATSADRDRLRNWRTAFTAALAKAQASHRGTELSAAGALLQPDAALADPRPPAGDYRCGVTKLGNQTPGGSDLVRYETFTCRISVEGDILSFAKVDGVQRPVGLLFPDSATRMVFLGTLMLSDETMAMQYGRDPERDMAGLFERIGTHRWRLVLPYPRWESMLDVIDLVPVS